MYVIDVGTCGPLLHLGQLWNGVTTQEHSLQVLHFKPCSGSGAWPNGKIKLA